MAGTRRRLNPHSGKALARVANAVSVPIIIGHTHKENGRKGTIPIILRDGQFPELLRIGSGARNNADADFTEVDGTEAHDGLAVAESSLDSIHTHSPVDVESGVGEEGVGNQL